MRLSRSCAPLALLLLILLARPAAAWPPPTPSERRLDAAIVGFTADLRFSERLEPTTASVKREQAAFFAGLAEGRPREPRLDYEPLPAALPGQARRFAAVPPAVGPYAPLLEGSRRRLLAKYDLLLVRGRPDFAARSALLSAPPDDALVAAAGVILASRRPRLEPRERPVTDRQMADHLRRTLAGLGLDGWKVRLKSRMSSKAAVSPHGRVVHVKRGANFAESDLVRLAYHEARVHAVRAENARALPLEVFSIGLDDYTDTEEGMAAFNEVRHGIRSGLRLFAGRVVTARLCETLPFSRVFDALKALGFDDEQAWSMAIRAKRGFVDTGMPGAYTKDVAYLRGYLEVRDWLARGGSWSALLRYGKVGLEQMPLLAELERR